jgi:hypothetical protein
MNFKVFPFFLVLSLLTNALWAQSEGGISVSGKVVGSGSEDPLPYATVVAYLEADSSIAGNALTEGDGTFELLLSPGEYYLVASYVGYEDRSVSPVIVKPDTKILDLGTINMQTNAVALQEVEVRAERSQMELKLDRRVFNVGKDLAID